MIRRATPGEAVPVDPTTLGESKYNDANPLKQNQLKIVAGFYDLATGSVTLLD